MKQKTINQFIKTSVLFMGINLMWAAYQALTLPQVKILAELGAR